MKIVNRTQSSLTNKSPEENVKEVTKELAIKYNKKRGKNSGVKVKLRPLIPGKDRVRVQVKFAKDKTMHKAYHGDQWSKRTYIIKSKRGDYYMVNGKSRHRDELKLTSGYDYKSESLLANR